MYEIYTQGGGVYIVDILNGVAALVGGENYITTMEISGMVALFLVAVRVAFGGQFKQTAIWIGSFTVLYNVLMLPKVTVNVVDRLNPTLPASIVANVPYGLAFSASLISEMGTKLTEMTEEIYTLPDDLQYQRTGMIFGSQLMAKTTQIKIVDSVFADNMNKFAQQCIFYDLLLHRYHINDLKAAENIWQFLTVDNFQSSLRGIFYHDGSSSSYKTCSQTAALLSTQWPAQITKAQNVYAPQLYPGKTPSAAKALLISQLPVSHEYLIGVSRDASSILQQNMMINAIHYSLADYAARTGSPTALDIYANARSDAQTEASYRIIARKAGAQISRLKVIFESIYYGSFPFIFLLMLLPDGFTFFRVYVMGLMWIQLWGPMNAILHRLMMGEAREGTLAASIMPDGSSALALVTQSGIEAINNDIAVTAGFFISTIPFISMILTKTGISAFGSLATSYLNISHGAATQAASESTTGNISLGNTSVANHSANNISANKHDTAGYVDTQTMRMQHDSGLRSSHFGGGHVAYDRSGMVSNLGEYKMSFSENFSQSLQTAADKYQSMSETASHNASVEMSAAHSQAGQMMYSMSQQRTSGTDWSERLSSEENRAVKEIGAHIQNFAASENIREDIAAKLLIGASANVPVSLGKLGLPDEITKILPSGGVNARVEGSGTVNSSEVYERAKQYTDTNQITGLISTGITMAENKNYNISDSDGSSYTDSISSHLNESRGYSQQSSEYASKGENFSQKAAQVRDNSSAWNKDMVNEFISWLPQQPRMDGSNMPLNEGGATFVLSANTPETSRYLEFYQSEFMAQKQDAVFNELENPLAGKKLSSSQFIEDNESMVNRFYEQHRPSYTPATQPQDHSNLRYKVPMGMEENKYITKTGNMAEGKSVEQTVKEEMDESVLHGFNKLDWPGSDDNK